MSPIQQQHQSDGTFTVSCDVCGRGELVGDVEKAEFPSGEYATSDDAIRAATDAGFQVGEPRDDSRPSWPARCAEHAEEVAP